MVLEAIFEKGDKIGWIWPFVNIVWCHLSVKIFGWMCIHEIFRVSLNPYGELIFQFSAKFSPGIASVTEGQVLAPFT